MRILRHNRIYTNDVIHQINKNVNKECDVCGREVENLMECGELKSFFEKIWNLLCVNWGRAFIENLEKKQLFLFGYANKKQKCKYKPAEFCSESCTICNMVYGIWHILRVRVKAWQVFESVLREVVSLIFKYVDWDGFQKYFVKGCDFVSYRWTVDI